MNADSAEKTHVVHTLMDTNGLESVVTKPMPRTKPVRTHQVVFSSRVNCFVLLQPSVWNRFGQGLSFGGSGPRELNQVCLDSSTEGEVGFNVKDGTHVETISSAEETMEVINFGV